MKWKETIEASTEAWEKHRATRGGEANVVQAAMALWKAQNAACPDEGDIRLAHLDLNHACSALEMARKR